MDGAAGFGQESLDPLEPGCIISGKYEIIRLIGEGGMGLVYEARHLRLNHRVAIKILHPDANHAPSHAARFEREARAAARLHGRHVARVYDVDTLPNEALFMVMEFLQGRDLSDEILLRGSIPAPEAVTYVLDACEAMAEAHRAGIVHRDLKPGNLFLTDTDNGRIIKVLDFGISKVTQDDVASVTRTQSTFGTPHYMSPEQVRSTKHVDGRSDIWSLGVILYEMLGGAPPFRGDSATAIIAAIAADTPVPLHELRPDLPRQLCEAVMVALAKNADERFSSVEAFATAIAPYGQGGALEADASGIDMSLGQPGAPQAGLDATIALAHPETRATPRPPGHDRLPERRRAPSWAARSRLSSTPGNAAGNGADHAGGGARSASDFPAAGAALPSASHLDTAARTVRSAPPTELPATEPQPPVAIDARHSSANPKRRRWVIAVAGLSVGAAAAVAVVLGASASGARQGEGDASQAPVTAPVASGDNRAAVVPPPAPSPTGSESPPASASTATASEDPPVDSAGDSASSTASGAVRPPPGTARTVPVPSSAASTPVAAASSTTPATTPSARKFRTKL